MATAAASLPWLVCDHGDEQRATTLYSVSDGARRPCEEIDAELRGKRSWVTSDGWILVWDQATLATFLWKPRAAAAPAPEEQNKNKIALQAWAWPPAPGTGCTLSRDPASAGCCTVVVLESSDTALCYCHVKDGGTSPSRWARYEYDVGGVWAPWDESVFAKRYAPPFAACRGRFYCDVSSDEYGVLEFSPEPALTVVEMTTGPVEVAVSLGEQWTQPFTYTLDLDGEVHTACIVFSGLDAEAEDVVECAVYRVDIAGRRRVRVDSIGDRAILAGGSNRCFAGWCPATESGLLPNSVYWVHPYDGRLHVYDVGANTEEVRINREAVSQPILDSSTTRINSHLEKTMRK